MSWAQELQTELNKLGAGIEHIWIADMQASHDEMTAVIRCGFASASSSASRRLPSHNRSQTLVILHASRHAFCVYEAR
jgi:hypothetical protein